MGDSFQAAVNKVQLDEISEKKNARQHLCNKKQRYARSRSKFSKFIDKTLLKIFCKKKILSICGSELSFEILN